MNTLAWQPSWSVGNDLLDADHKRLIAIIQNIGKYREAHANVTHLISELEDYTKTHFAREEQMMEEAKVPGLTTHKKAHAMFIEWLDAIRRAFSASSESQALLIDDVDAYLQTWLTDHILKTDMSYKGQL